MTVNLKDLQLGDTVMIPVRITRLNGDRSRIGVHYTNNPKIISTNFTIDGADIGSVLARDPRVGDVITFNDSPERRLAGKIIAIDSSGAFVLFNEESEYLRTVDPSDSDLNITMIPRSQWEDFGFYS